jgi:hypothetical protein
MQPPTREVDVVQTLSREIHAVTRCHSSSPLLGTEEGEHLSPQECGGVCVVRSADRWIEAEAMLAISSAIIASRMTGTEPLKQPDR